MSEIAEEMKQMADVAVEVARNTYQVDLDYSEDSIRRTEEILDSLHKGTSRNFIDKLLKRGLTENQINSAALMLGAYVGETIRRLHGGEWVKEDTMGEKGVLTLKVGDTNIFPAGKVYKRIVNGSEDDIWFYYRVITEELITTKDK